MMLGIVFCTLCLLIFTVGTMIHEQITKRLSKKVEVSHH